MKRINSIKLGVSTLTLFIMATTVNAAGNSFLDSVNSGLTTVEKAAQSGQQAIDSGAQVINSGAQAIDSGITAANTIGTNGIGLADVLANQLGVSQQQALGGAGAIFQTAKANMDPQAFANLSQSVPGLDSMLNAVPQAPNSVSSVADGLSAIAGGTNNAIGSAASLANSFNQLNLSPDMVGQFIPVVTNYVKVTSGEVAANLLQTALSAP